MALWSPILARPRFMSHSNTTSVRRLATRWRAIATKPDITCCWFNSAYHVQIPIPRYQPQYARTIARWAYRVASSTRYFYGDQPEIKGHQSNPNDHWDRLNVVAYEGLRKCDFNRTVQQCLHGEDFGPFATGDWCEMLDCDNINWACRKGLPCSSGSNRVLYGGGGVGVLGGIVATTDDEYILQLDLLATDVYRASDNPVYLVYNPKATAAQVHIVCHRCRTVGYVALDLVSGTVLGSCKAVKGQFCAVAVTLAADTAAVIELQAQSSDRA